MERETMNTRVRGNFTTTAKGLAQVDITAEAETTEEMGKLLAEGFDAVMKVIKDNNIKSTHEVE